MTAGTPPPTGSRLVGRAVEHQRLLEEVRLAATAEARTVLVTGPAGVGKTSLWQAAVAAAGVRVVVGRCLPLVSVSVPFGAIRSAVAGVPGAGSTPEEVVGGAEATVPTRFDRWLDERCTDGPFVLVVEDLHWADQPTLDTLLFVIAGPGARPLATVVTLRSEEIAGRLPLRGWLSDVRRLPRVTEVALAPLDRLGTGEQLADLLGGQPHQGLIDDVFRRGRGVPLFTKLLAQGATPRDARAPTEVSSSLREAVLQSWFRLDAGARDVVALLAVGSGPLLPSQLAHVSGLAPAVVERHLGAAVRAGLVERLTAGTYWFRHPLNAEVLEDAVPPDERARWHATFADALEVGEGAGPVAVATRMADHRYRAGDERAAYAWAVRAADAQLEAGVPSEAIRLLRRAVELAPRVEATESPVALLRRLRLAAARAGAFADELDAVERLLALLAPAAEPLAVAELRVRRALLRFTMGEAFFDPGELAGAVALAASVPGSPEHALALAELAHAELWHGESSGPAHAAEALGCARGAGDDRALAYALTSTVMARVCAGDAGAASALADEAVRVGLASRDWWVATHAIFWETNAIDTWACPAYAAAIAARREQLAAAGAPHVYVARVAGAEADSRLSLGEWERCAALLRETFAADPGPLADASARLCAARLAARQGRPGEALQHLARADEIFPTGSANLAMAFDATRAEVALWAGDVEAAWRAAQRGLAHENPRTMCEWLVPFAARALADEARTVRDARREPDAVLRRVDELARRQPRIVRDLGPATPAYEQVVEALGALATAEFARARLDADEGERWAEASEALRSVGLAWEEAYACRRGAEALLDRPGHDRAAARVLLRRGLELARRLDARPVQQELDALATRARVATGAVPAAGPGPGRPGGGDPRAAGRRAHLRRDRADPRHQREDGELARVEPAGEDRHGQPGRPGRLRAADRARRPALTLLSCGAARTSPGRCPGACRRRR